MRSGFFVLVLWGLSLIGQVAFGFDGGRGAFTVIANPGADGAREVGINFHTELGVEGSVVKYAPADVEWGNAKTAKAKWKVCEVYDSMYSKRANGEDFYEEARFVRNVARLKGLEPGTRYKYRINEDTVTRYFTTGPVDGVFTAAIISDFHCYPPIPGRQRAAMEMLDTLRSVNGKDFDMIIHLGDVCAWGGSYSFWEQLYDEQYFRNYSWAGLNGNHDDMDRTGKKNSNQFFKNANAAPMNGYEGQEGVCYYFKYGDVMFIALNSEAMRNEEGLAEAQAWVEKILEEEKPKRAVVMEHYQWFYGQNGKDGQYPRWREVFDKHGVELALGGNNHRYVSTPALRAGHVAEDGNGTVYIQTPSSDNDRGEEIGELEFNAELIKTRWTEGRHTVGAMLMRVTPERIELTLYDRYGNEVDSNVVGH
ncbi:MAG: metallophosphoesterase family protein [Clostridium sp.]|nr:metallophosphoesterase family protein [Clostridium sp.]